MHRRQATGEGEEQNIRIYAVKRNSCHLFISLSPGKGAIAGGARREKKGKRNGGGK